jgi:dihydroflavonol-4-reductase
MVALERWRMDLVTGGSGFIGHHLVAELVDRGHDVRVYDRKPFPADAAVEAARRGLKQPISKPISRRGATEVVLADILDADELRKAMRGCQRVFHLAADPNLWNRDPNHFDRVNREGTELLLRLAKEARVERVIYTSTESILTPRRSRGLVTEEVKVELSDMIGDYCRSKFLAEQAATHACTAGLPVVIVNPTMPIGPGDRALTPPTRMIADFLAGRTPAYLNARLSFVDVRDAALGHVLAAERGVPGRRHLLVGGCLALGDFFALLGKIVGRRPPRVRVPYAVALGMAYAEEVLGRWTGRHPRAPVTGVRLAGRQLELDGTWTLFRLGLRTRPMVESLKDAARWLQDEGLIPN